MEAQLSLDDMFVAYRKAKTESYWDNNLASGLKFARYEEHLEENLRRLLTAINERDAAHWTKVENVGGLLAIPKRPQKGPEPLATWHFLDVSAMNEAHDAVLPFRAIIDPTVDFQVLSVLWALKVGEVLDRELDDNHVFANRVNRVGYTERAVDLTSHRLYRLYSEQYKRWQESGYLALHEALSSGSVLTVFHLDIKDFFNSINPEAALHSATDRVPEWSALTDLLQTGIATWNEAFLATPTGLPVGLLASGIIANVLLTPLDEGCSAVGGIYYGRYVDDIFLATSDSAVPANPSGAIEWLVAQLPMLRLRVDDPGPVLELQLTNHPPFQVSSEKLSINRLSGAAGIELLESMRMEQDARASEQRLKPALPSDPLELGRRALILRDGNHDQTNDLRSVRSVELKRAAFAQVLRVMEQYGRDLDHGNWKRIRKSFYGLIQRHVLTVQGLFTYHKRIGWIAALMTSCRDVEDLHELLDRLSDLRLSMHVESGSLNQYFWINLARQLEESILGATSDDTQSLVAGLDAKISQTLGLLEELTWAEPSNLRTALRRTDWARDPYYAAWLAGEPVQDDLASAPDGLVPEAVFRFQKQADLGPFDWRPLCFPVRPMTRYLVSSMLPIGELPVLSTYLEAFKGVRSSGVKVEYVDRLLRVGRGGLFRKRHGAAIIAVASIETTEAQVDSSLQTPVPTDYERYRHLRNVITATLRERGPVDYLVMPELSLPRRWVEGVANQLDAAGISLIAGLEYKVRGNVVRNQALCCLSSRQGPGALVAFTLDKSAPAWVEAKKLEGRFEFQGHNQLPVIVEHDGFAFAVLICSDLTNISLRSSVRGAIDSLIVLEWNRDTDGFAHLVAATTTDLHCFVVQVNNRQHGDSWIRGPYCERYDRDVLRVKGGRADFVVSGTLNFGALRDFQRNRPGAGCEEQKRREKKEEKQVEETEAKECGKKKQNEVRHDSSVRFKPVPIGFEMSPARRGTRPWHLKAEGSSPENESKSGYS